MKIAIALIAIIYIAYNFWSALIESVSDSMPDD